MKFRSWREQRECLSDDENTRCKCKRRKSLLCQSVNWNILQDRTSSDSGQSSSSQMSVALFDELNLPLDEFKSSDLLGINIRALEVSS